MNTWNTQAWPPHENAIINTVGVQSKEHLMFLHSEKRHTQGSVCCSAMANVTIEFYSWSSGRWYEMCKLPGKIWADQIRNCYGLGPRHHVEPWKEGTCVVHPAKELLTNETPPFDATPSFFLTEDGNGMQLLMGSWSQQPTHSPLAQLRIGKKSSQSEKNPQSVYPSKRMNPGWWPHLLGGMPAQKTWTILRITSLWLCLQENVREFVLSLHKIRPLPPQEKHKWTLKPMKKRPDMHTLDEDFWIHGLKQPSDTLLHSKVQDDPFAASSLGWAMSGVHSVKVQTNKQDSHIHRSEIHFRAMGPINTHRTWPSFIQRLPACATALPAIQVRMPESETDRLDNRQRLSRLTNPACYTIFCVYWSYSGFEGTWQIAVDWVCVPVHMRTRTSLCTHANTRTHARTCMNVHVNFSMHDTPLSSLYLCAACVCCQASGFRLLFYILVNVKALVTGSITKWSPRSTVCLN